MLCTLNNNVCFLRINNNETIRTAAEKALTREEPSTHYLHNTPNTGHNISRNDRHKHPVLKKCMVEMLFPLWRGFASSSSMVTIESLHMTLWTDKNNKMTARTQDRFSSHHYFFHMNYGVDITRYKQNSPLLQLISFFHRR